MMGGEQLLVEENFLLCRKEETSAYKVSRVLQSGVTAAAAHERGEQILHTTGIETKFQKVGSRP